MRKVVSSKVTKPLSENNLIRLVPRLFSRLKGVKVGLGVFKGFFKIKFLCNYNSEYFTFVIPKYLVMAFLSSWLTVNRYRRLSYTLGYYDARRERREEFVRQMEKGEQYGPGIIIGNSFRIQRGFLNTMRHKHHKENNASFILLVFILFALVVIFYLLLR